MWKQIVVTLTDSCPERGVLVGGAWQHLKSVCRRFLYIFWVAKVRSKQANISSKYPTLNWKLFLAQATGNGSRACCGITYALYAVRVSAPGLHGVTGRGGRKGERVGERQRASQWNIDKNVGADYEWKQFIYLAQGFCMGIIYLYSSCIYTVNIHYVAHTDKVLSCA